MIQSVRSAIVRTSTTPTPPPGAVKDASATKTSSIVDGRISWVKRDTDLRKYTSIMIAPVSIYDGADIDWGNTGPADRTEIANYLQTAYTKAIGRSMRIVKTPGPNTLLLENATGCVPIRRRRDRDAIPLPAILFTTIKEGRTRPND